MNLTSRNQDPIHASLALSSLFSVWYKPNSLNNKSKYNTLLLEFYICAKPRLTHWYQCPQKKCHYFCTGVYKSGIPKHKDFVSLNVAIHWNANVIITKVPSLVALAVSILIYKFQNSKMLTQMLCVTLLFSIDNLRILAKLNHKYFVGMIGIW